jgi:DNA-binding FadR family transcriptional regulator
MDRLYRRVMSELLEAIVTGELAASEALPGAHAVADRHACSPATAREAIRALEERGLVAVRAGRGQRVLEPDRWHLLDPDVARAVLLDHPGHAFLREAVEALRLVETQAARLAARRAGRGDVEALSAALERMRRATADARRSGREIAEAEADFHRLLVLLSANRFLAAMLESLHPALATARRRRAADRDPIVIRLHERIVGALRARDELASAAAVDDYGRQLGSWLRA